MRNLDDRADFAARFPSHMPTITAAACWAQSAAFIGQA